MKIFKRRLFHRLKSLEEYLGLAYQGDDDWHSHNELEHSLLARTNKRLDLIERKLIDKDVLKVVEKKDTYDKELQ